MAEDVKSFLGVPKASIKSACGVLAASSIAAVCRVPWIRGGDRGIFGGGYSNTVGTVATIDYITISSAGNATSFGSLNSPSTQQLSSCSNGGSDRGLFGGGYVPSSPISAIRYVAISSVGNATSFGSLITTSQSLGGTSNGSSDRGLFAGGLYGTTYLDNIDYVAISSAGNGTDFGNLTQGRYCLSGASNATNDKGIFYSGGVGSSDYSYTIDQVTISSAANATSFGGYAIPIQYCGATSNGTNNLAVFGGGNYSGVTYSIYYQSLTSPSEFAQNFGNLTRYAAYLSAVSNGTNNRGVFGGGFTTGSAYSNILDYVNISSASDAADFGDLTVARGYLASTSNA